MTPKFLYDPQQHCLREVARMEEPALSEFKTNAYWMAKDVYNDHLASLRVIPCLPGMVWKEGELGEVVDFTVMQSLEDGKKFAFPITNLPRTFTLAEVLEIFQDAYRLGMTYTMAENGTHVDPLSTERQQYFKTRFNVELTPQTP